MWWTIIICSLSRCHIVSSAHFSWPSCCCAYHHTPIHTEKTKKFSKIGVYLSSALHTLWAVSHCMMELDFDAHQFQNCVDVICAWQIFVTAIYLVGVCVFNWCKNVIKLMFSRSRNGKWQFGIVQITTDTLVFSFRLFNGHRFFSLRTSCQRCEMKLNNRSPEKSEEKNAFFSIHVP